MLAAAIISIGAAFTLFAGLFVFILALARYVPGDRGFRVKVSLVPLSVIIQFSKRGAIAHKVSPPPYSGSTRREIRMRALDSDNISGAGPNGVTPLSTTVLE